MSVTLMRVVTPLMVMLCTAMAVICWQRALYFPFVVNVVCAGVNAGIAWMQWVWMR